MKYISVSSEEEYESTIRKYNSEVEAARGDKRHKAAFVVN